MGQLNFLDNSNTDQHYRFVVLEQEDGFFTVWNSEGKAKNQFWICKKGDGLSTLHDRIESTFNPALYVQGDFEILANATGSSMAPRLLEWWSKRGDADPEKYALWCAQHIGQRGLKDLPPMPYEEPGTPLLDQIKETTKEPTIERIPLALITLNAGTQSRQRTEEFVIDRYAEMMLEGEWDWSRNEYPILYRDEHENLYPGDGHHRIAAAKRAGLEIITCEVRSGTLRDAIYHSLGANAFHGIPRTNADKRHQVEIALRDAEWSQMSDRQIAEHCHVSAPLVGSIRKELLEKSEIAESTTRKTKAGKVIETKSIGRKPTTGKGKEPIKKDKEFQPYILEDQIVWDDDGREYTALCDSYLNKEFGIEVVRVKPIQGKGSKSPTGEVMEVSDLSISKPTPAPAPTLEYLSDEAPEIAETGTAKEKIIALLDECTIQDLLDVIHHIELTYDLE